MTFVKLAITAATLTMASSTFAADFNASHSKYQQEGEVEFSREVPEFFGIDVLEGDGVIAFSGEEDKKAAKIKVISNSSDGKLKLIIKTIETSDNIEKDKIVYLVKAGDDQEIIRGEEGELVVNSEDIIEIWPSYDDKITDVTAGQAMFKAELSVEEN